MHARRECEKCKNRKVRNKCTNLKEQSFLSNDSELLSASLGLAVSCMILKFLNVGSLPFFSNCTAIVKINRMVVEPCVRVNSLFSNSP